MAEMINKTLAGRYRVDDFVRRGGMGAVYRGRDLRTDQIVAIKHLREDAIDAETGMVARFAREGEALRALNHPNIVKMLDAFEDRNEHYLVMEYIGGGSLSDLLAKQPQVSIRRVIQIGIDLADALTRAHRLDIIHRDIKPANVLLREDGTPLLTDFGVARVGDSSLTAVGEVVGTYAYLSPEALDGESLDPRSDIWSFGVMLFEMLTGRKPFDEKSYPQLLIAILQKPLPDLEALRPDAPIALVDLVYRMLERDRDRRIRSVRLVGAELEAIAQGTQLPNTTPGKRVFIPLGEDERTQVFNTPISSTNGSTSHNLPVQTTPFVGREAELSELARLLNLSDTRLVTVTAPGGMGKTRLALEAAHMQLNQFKDGAFYVALANLSKADDVVPAVAEAIRFTFFDGTVPQRQQLIDSLRNRQMLLILDNFEHLMDANDLVTEILKSAPHVRLLVTSRERMNIEGETLFRLDPMDFPEWETPENALEYSAVKLFLQSARRVQPSFAITPENVRFIARICRVVQGVPLAIILAAAWVEALSLEEIAAEIEKNLDFLESDQRDLPERQRSLRAVFEYSWNLLNPTERDIFKKLSVFKGKFTREAAQHITNAPLKTLMGLVSKSLLHRDPASGNYETHNMLRLYAHEQLKETPADHAAIHERHGLYYLELLRKQAVRLQGREQTSALGIIQNASSNVLSAWKWAVENRRAEAVAETCESMAIFQFVTSDMVGGIQTSRQAVQVLRTDRPEGKTGCLYGFALAMNGFMEIMHSGDINKKEQIQQGAEILKQLGSPREVAIIEVARAVFENTGQLDATIDKNVQILKDAGGHWWASQILSLLAIMLSHQPGMLGVAKHYLQTANDISESLGDQFTQDGTLAILGYITFMEGDFEKAREYMQQGVTIFEARGDKANLGFLLSGIGQIQSFMGEYKAAWESLRRAYDMARDMGVPMLRMEVAMAMGILAWNEHNYAQARTYLLEGLEASRGTFDYRSILGTLYGSLGIVLTSLGEYAEANRYLRMSLRKNLDYNLPDEVIQSLAGIAYLLGKTGKLETAIEYLSCLTSDPAVTPTQTRILQIFLEDLKPLLLPAQFNTAWEHGKSFTREAIAALYPSPN